MAVAMMSLTTVWMSVLSVSFHCSVSCVAALAVATLYAMLC